MKKFLFYAVSLLLVYVNITLILPLCNNTYKLSPHYCHKILYII